MEIEMLPTCVQVLPSGDEKPVSVFPDRTSLTQYGAAAVAVPPARLLGPLAVPRYCMLTPLPGVTATIAWRAPAARLSRIITPALAHWSVFSTDATRATICPSPTSGM